MGGIAMEYKYTFPGIPPSNNRFIGRRNNWEYNKVKKQWEALIAYCCRNKPPKPLERVEICIEYFFPTKRRRDPDNYGGKMLFDGLVKSGIIIDDSFTVIEDIRYRHNYDKTNPRTEITITERNELCESKNQSARR